MSAQGPTRPPVSVERTVVCRSSPERLWTLLADTERLNRMSGMAPFTSAEPVEGASGARWQIRTRLDGFPVVYEEVPFEWQTPSRFLVRRIVLQGPIDLLEFSLEIDPVEGGSQVRWRLSVWPRFFLLRPVARLLGWWRVRAIGASTLALDAAPDQLPAAPASQELPAAGSRLAGAVETADVALARRLVDFVTTAPDADVLGMRPFALADQWGEPRDRVLGVFLEAVGAGLVEMHWDIVCPSCRTGASRVERLYELSEAGHCEFCDLRFDLPLDRAVEAVFQPARTLRVVEIGPYCTGGPMRTPHVLAQAPLPQDGIARLGVPEAPGKYRVFVRGGATTSITVLEGGPSEVTLGYDGALTPEAIEVAPGGLIQVHQAGGSTRHCKLENTAWVDSAATAHALSLNPRFRRMFSGEVLGPGRQLRVARIALHFSDLSGSTALYSRVGDASAFRLVQDHFDLLGLPIGAEGGVVVKTIGDAVMAAFPDEVAALRAAVAMQASWGEFSEAHPEGQGVMLKIGVHAGPAYVVTANGVLDYFGQTVNLAARLQGAAHEGEIVVIQALADRAIEEGHLGAARVGGNFAASLKGLEAPVRAARIVVPSSGAGLG